MKRNKKILTVVMVMTAFIAVGILWWKYSDHTKAGAVQWIDVEKPETYMPEMMSLQGSSSSSGKTVERDNKFKKYIVSCIKDRERVATIGENYKKYYTTDELLALANSVVYENPKLFYLRKIGINLRQKTIYFSYKYPPAAISGVYDREFEETKLESEII